MKKARPAMENGKWKMVKTNRQWRSAGPERFTIDHLPFTILMQAVTSHQPA
jgi:hypothetical protein